MNEQLQKKLEIYKEENEKSKIIENELRIYKEKFDNFLKDKIEMENFICNQENKVKNFENEINKLNEEINDKDIKYKKLDKSYLSMLKIIDEYKKNNKNLQNRLNKKINEEKNNKLLVYEKDQEINLLRKFINNLKHEKTMRISSSQNNIFVNKKKLIQNHNSQKNFLPKINTNCLNNNNINYQKKIEETSFNLDNNLSYKNLISINDPEEENLKEITNLLKKILNE